MLVADSPLSISVPVDMFKQSMDASLAAAEDILSNWQSGQFPEELKALVALKDEKGQLGKFPKLLPHWRLSGWCAIAMLQLNKCSRCCRLPPRGQHVLMRMPTRCWLMWS